MENFSELHLVLTGHCHNVGSRNSADLQVSGSNIAEEHAEVFQKGGRTYCRAMAGDEEDTTSSSYTWLDGSESPLRTGESFHAAC